MRTLWVDGNKDVRENDWNGKDGPVWADCGSTPDEEALRRLFDPHPMALRQLTGAARTGLFLYRDAVVFAFKAPVDDDAEGQLATVRVALGQHFLLTIHDEPVGVVDRVWDLARAGAALAQGPDLMLYDLIVAQIHLFEEAERHLLNQYEALHDTLLRNPSRDLSHRILVARKSFLRLRLVLEPETRALDLLSEGGIPWVDKHHRPYFQDAANRLQDLVQEVDTTREGLSGTVEAYASLQSNEINKVMKFLTIISVLALPATTIASIYGMNFAIPELHWWFGYWYSLALMASITGTLLWYMKHHQWFR